MGGGQAVQQQLSLYPEALRGDGDVLGLAQGVASDVGGAAVDVGKDDAVADGLGGLEDKVEAGDVLPVLQRQLDDLPLPGGSKQNYSCYEVCNYELENTAQGAFGSEIPPSLDE